ncbi:MAG: (2Fe-2S)-binding protein [Alkalispirochaetaceae bacterium]
MSEETRELLICRCEEVGEAEILRAIELGLTSANEIKRFTRAGMGLCQGQTCAALLAAILERETGKADRTPPRAPVRPVAMGELARDGGRG